MIIRSIFFWLATYLAVLILIVCFLFLSLFIKKERLADNCAKIWSRAIIFFLKKICKIDYEIIGGENLTDGPLIIACKHQSMWETIIFHLICKNPSYIYKKELSRIPFYGWYVRRMSGIEIDRNGGASALKKLIKQAQFMLDKNYEIIIFPQGTRTAYGKNDLEKYPYQAGIAALYAACNAKVIPASLNSGKFWGKGMLIKNSGKIKIQFAKPIESGMDKKEFMEELKNRIESIKL